MSAPTPEPDNDCGHPNHGGEDHDCAPFVSGDQLDLDALLEWAATERPETDEAVCALVAEVRRLRENEARVLRWVETWEKEAAERGPGDRVYTAGVAAHLRLSIRQPEPLP